MLVVGQLGTWSLEHWHDHTTRSLLRLGGYLKLCLCLHILLYWAAWPFSLGSSVFESFWRSTKTKHRSLRIQSRASLSRLLGFLFIQSIGGHRCFNWFIIRIETINALGWSHVRVVCPQRCWCLRYCWLRQSIFLPLLVDLIANIICFLQRPSPKHWFLIGYHKCRKVSTAHFTPLEQSASKATLVHLDEFHEVLQG